MLKLQHGVSLIEIVIGITILALLISLGAPNFADWIRNMRIRTAAESVLSGLQLARSEALKGNSIVRFQFTDTFDDACKLSVNGPHWIVSRGDATGKCNQTPSDTVAPRIVQFHDGSQGGGNQTKINSDQKLFTFNGLGRLTSTPGNILVSGLGGVNNCASQGGTTRCLRIELNSGGGIRLCDPALPNTDSQACS